MRHRAEVTLIVAMSVFAVTGFVGVALQGAGDHDPIVEPPILLGVEAAPGMETPEDAPAWFQSFRRFCNPVDVESRLRVQPAPATPDGAMYEAACYALAGLTGRSREVIESLPPELRSQATGVVFAAGHVAADAGDDIAAGPLMELVLDYWPDHYMALYHAGAARYGLGDYEVAETYLRRFLDEYSVDDGWRSSAISMLDQISAGSG